MKFITALLLALSLPLRAAAVRDEDGGEEGLAVEARARTASGDPCKGDETLTTEEFDRKMEWRDNLEFEDPRPECLGRGAYGVAFKVKAKNCDNFEVVVKRQSFPVGDDLAHLSNSAIDEVQSNQGLAEKERLIMKEFNHPHVARLYHAFQQAHGAYFLLEYLAGGELSLTALDPKIKLRLFAEALEGVAHIHEKGVVHRDLKPENILLTSDCTEDPKCHAKVADFGLACEAGEDCEKNIAGTPGYMAPEAFFHETCEKSDVWAMGLILYEALHSENPVRDCVLEDMTSLREKIPKEHTIDRDAVRVIYHACIRKIFPIRSGPEEDELLQGMLQLEHEDRLTAKEALEKFYNGLGKDIERIDEGANRAEPPEGCDWFKR